MPSVVVNILATMLAFLLASYTVNSTIWYWVAFLYVIGGLCAFWENCSWSYISWLALLWVTVIGYLVYPFATPIGG